jgi:hypothetical protein
MRKSLVSLLFSCVVMCLPSVAQNSEPRQSAPTSQRPPELVIDQIKKTVVFLETTWQETPPLITPTAVQTPPKVGKIFGTGFLIYVQIDELGRTDKGDTRGQNFLVTAKHMIQQETDDHQAGPYAQRTTIRYNTSTPVDPSGRSWKSFDGEILDKRGDLQWFVDDLDPSADVALTPIGIGDQDMEYRTIPVDSFATKSVVQQHHVNENDEVLFTGLFTEYFGALKNYPIVRHGRLALLPGEDIGLEKAKPDQKTQIYLAEVTSFGGNSGSPVFLRLGGVREELTANSFSGYTYLLLGVMKGFVPDEEAKQNSGIAIVVPSDKIVKILSGERVKAILIRAVAEDRAAKGDLSTAERKYQEVIAILEKQAPDSSQMISALQGYGAVLKRDKRAEDASSVLARADKLASKPVAKMPQP